ncbi:MAG: universal stress protein [Candidatus Bathyarchaeota archaeon]|nr:universal stress protein [Candidatus Bathyarchaeota archaeon]
MITPFHEIKKILIPTDGSDYSMRAAEYGISIAKVFGAQVTALFVIDTLVLDQISKVTTRENAEADLKQDGERYTNYVLDLAEKENIKADSMIAKGNPVEQIVNFAKNSADLIVMGTYGRRGAERILIGSVAERVIEHASCPVLVIK